ncbi:MAG: polysaccharide biosynthesis protein [Pseudomonadales bacterium]|jgi:FlaA1/EpsC-like NDP-sugar epimerase|nr:polysaccharide biosynthesis protein [Pseudomonadales bacterium]
MKSAPFSLSRPLKHSFMMLTDGILIVLALWLSLVLVDPRFFALHQADTYTVLFALSAVCSVAVFYQAGLYRTVLLYMGIQSGLVIFKGITISTMLIGLIVYVTDALSLPGKVLVVFWMTALLSVGGLRFAIKLMMQNVLHNFRPREPVIIYGAGSSGMQLVAALNNGEQYLPVAFVDDSEALVGNTVHGIRVYSPAAIRELIDDYAVRQILLAMPSATHGERKQILNKLECYPVHVRTVPDMFDILSGNVAVDEIRDIDIEDLLGRDIVPPDPQLMSACIRASNVLITGAGGSIGSELCRQIIKLKPSTMVLYDNFEYGLYTIESELKEIQKLLEHGRDIKIIAMLGSIRNQDQVESALRKFNIRTVYHAAAYKHVPMVEKNVVEGVRNNVFGTYVLAKAADKFQVENFVFVSTDKAVRPANVMGATKRFAEQILQSLSARGSRTKFSMVRFGNVLGSSGSVVPLFRRQIARGGPVTVTHSEMTRYFMTVQEAAQLVIQAGSIASGGDVFVLDMHDPVRIVDLAKKMIHLMGYIIKDEHRPNGDIAIEYTGLRPGEKLYEELLIGEQVTGTDHPKIMRAEEDFLSWEALQDLLKRLEHSCAALDPLQIREVLSEAIGGFISKETVRDPLLEAQKAARQREDESKKVLPLFKTSA